MNLVQKEHNPPHIHALYGGDEAIYDIRSGESLAGKLPKKQDKLVRTFVNSYKDELLEAWNTNDFGKLDFKK